MRAQRSMTRDLFAARGDVSRRPKGVEQLVPRMIAALDGRGWVAGAVLASQLGVDLRALRDAASHSGGRILGHQKGYALTVAVPLVDVHAVTRRLLSQSSEMKRRVADIERVRHASGVDFQDFAGGAA